MARTRDALCSLFHKKFQSFGLGQVDFGRRTVGDNRETRLVAFEKFCQPWNTGIILSRFFDFLNWVLPSHLFQKHNVMFCLLEMVNTVKKIFLRFLPVSLDTNARVPALPNSAIPSVGNIICTFTVKSVIWIRNAASSKKMGGHGSNMAGIICPLGPNRVN